MMTNIIPWSDGYIIGIDKVDQQHKYLFELINKIIQCAEKTKLQLLLIQLYKYTREHFKTEETLMKEVNYTQYSQHVDKHNRLLKKLTEKSNVDLDDPMKKEELDSFLINWLIQHTLKEDADIDNHIKNNNIFIDMSGNYLNEIIQNNRLMYNYKIQNIGVINDYQDTNTLHYKTSNRL